MAYRLKSSDRSVGHAVRRIADEQIGKALVALERSKQAEAIHDLRKRCKKLRGLIRLVRPSFDRYSAENAAFRDLAQSVSGARDAKVMQDTYDVLMEDYAGQVERQALGSIRRRFTLERDARARDDDLGKALDETRERLEQARDRAAGWELADDGWAALAGGLRKTYGRARDAAGLARSCPTDEAFHELRKRIKYHWYHCRLLENVWPEMMDLRQRSARRLSDILGEHHDLSVFAGRIGEEPDAFGSAREVETAIGLARARQQRLEDEAWPLVDRLLAQKPKALAGHLEALWRVWRKGA